MRFAYACAALLKYAKIRRAQPFVYSRNRKRFHRQLEAVKQYIRQRRIPRCSLLSVSKSSWRRVFMSGDYQAMITLTRFDLPYFHFLANLFAPIYEQYTP